MWQSVDRRSTTVAGLARRRLSVVLAQWRSTEVVAASDLGAPAVREETWSAPNGNSRRWKRCRIRRGRGLVSPVSRQCCGEEDLDGERRRLQIQGWWWVLAEYGGRRGTRGLEMMAEAVSRSEATAGAHGEGFVVEDLARRICRGHREVVGELWIGHE